MTRLRTKLPQDERSIATPFGDFKQATSLPLANDARRYTQSTMSYISIVGLGVAIGELIALNPEKIKDHSDALAEVLLRMLLGTGWVSYRPIKDKAAATHIIALSHPTAGSDETLQSLLDANIVCSVRNGRVRVSLAHYNDESDVHAIVAALERVATH